VPVEPGDTIVVSKAGVVYVVGDVHQPGGFVMENGNEITVLKAIALAQGTNPNAKLDSARLIRKTPEGPQDVPLSLTKLWPQRLPIRNCKQTMLSLFLTAPEKVRLKRELKRSCKWRLA